MTASLRPIPKKALRHEAYEALKRAIVEGTIEPGAQLSEPQLAERFEVSRSPVREALGRLEQEGFALRQPNGRLQVAPLDIEELEQLYVLRANVEGLATRLAAAHLSTSDLERMADTLKRMEKAATAGDIEVSLGEGGRFHDSILDHCGNKPLMEVVLNVRLRIDRFRKIIASQRDQTVRIAEHWRIYQALYERDAEAAGKAMTEHIGHSAEAVLTGAKSRNRTSSD